MKKNFFYLFLLTLACVLTTSCSPTQRFCRYLDIKSFEKFGSTFFSTPGMVTMKEIHLDKGMLLGQEVIIEGSIITLGKYGTYLVATDNTARMLVVMTDILKSYTDADVLNKTIRIWGEVRDGKKGLPYIQAKSFILKVKTDTSKG